MVHPLVNTGADRERFGVILNDSKIGFYLLIGRLMCHCIEGESLMSVSSPFSGKGLHRVKGVSGLKGSHRVLMLAVVAALAGCDSLSPWENADRAADTRVRRAASMEKEGAEAGVPGATEGAGEVAETEDTRRAEAGRKASQASEPIMTDTAPAKSAGVLQEALRRDVAPHVYELAYSPSQKLLFVASPGEGHGKTVSELKLLNPSTLEEVARIRLPLRGMGLALDDAAERLYVTHAHDGAISIIDTKARKHLKTIRVSKELEKPTERMKFVHMLRQVVVDADSGRVFAPGLHGTDSVLFVIDAKTGKLEKTLPGFGFQATGIALDKRHGRVFVSNMQGQVMVVDAKTLTLTHTWEVPADQLLNLAYEPKSNMLMGVDQGLDRNAWRNQHLGRSYAPRSKGNTLVFLDAANGRVISQQETGEVPISLAVDADRNRVVVTSRGNLDLDKGEGSLSVFDLDSHQRVQLLLLPPHPNSLTLDAEGRRVFVSLKNDKLRGEAGQLEQVVGFRIQEK